MKRIRIKQSDDVKVFFSSDFHFDHGNICLGSTKWVTPPKPYDEMNKLERAEFSMSNGVRPFRDVAEMNSRMIESINDIVKPDDILFHLGDWSFRDPLKTRNQLACQNLYCLFGNHDKEINNLSGRTVIPPISALEVEVDGQLIYLHHYKQLVWNKRHHGAWHLYGHSHSNFEHVVVGKSMDVGVDNAFRELGEFRPFSFEEIADRLNKRDAAQFSVNGSDIANATDHHSTRE